MSCKNLEDDLHVAAVLVHREKLGDDTIPSEPLQGGRTSPLSYRMSLFRTVEQGTNPLRIGARIGVVGYEIPVFLVDDNFRHASALAADDRQAGRHRFIKSSRRRTWEYKPEKARSFRVETLIL